MRILRKLVYVCCSITLGLMALSSCEGGELYDVNAPDWISEKVDSIADSKKEPEEEVLEGMQEDVYSFGNTDYTSGFWTAFSKYYVCPTGRNGMGCSISTSIPPTIPIIKTSPSSLPTIQTVEEKDIRNMVLIVLTLQTILWPITPNGVPIFFSNTHPAH